MKNIAVAAVTALLFVSTLEIEGSSQDISLQKAARAFNDAQELEAELNEKSTAERTRNEYARVIDAYQRVYLITPHTGYADNALMTIARLYEEIKDTRAAIRTLTFLLRDYPGTPFRDSAEKDLARLQGVPERKTSAVDNVRYWDASDSVRVVVDVSGDVTIKQGELKSPNRVFIDISPARLNSMLLGKQWQVKSGLLQQIRVGQYEASTVRVVFEVSGAGRVSSFTLRDPDRIVVDIGTGETTAATRVAATAVASEGPAPTAALTPVRAVATEAKPPDPGPKPAPAPTTALTPGRAAATEAKPADPGPKPAPAPTAPLTPARAVATETKAGDTGSKPAPAPTAALTPARAVARGAKPADPGPKPVVTAAKPTDKGDHSLVRSLGLKLSRVVIDAGHGGHDTGSIGPSGYTEKELVLDVARRLQKLIATELGAEVVMTRDDDIFVPLESRTTVANQQQADLFISVHANSSSVRSVRGVETFFLNFTTSREALETASRENASSERSIHELQDIVKKIMLQDKVDESRELASHIQRSLVGKKGADFDRGVKQAPFVVLIGANMPSILAEICFISNPQDEKQIKSPQYRQQIAQSLFEGVRSYSETLSATKTVKTQDKNQE